ncbi:hypothetical protein AB0D67_09250 [Streptosporangium sp. NPDC048047]|uniref:hypothetical protein n=1 Tax=Streptosporangium sp. NPDC048047 TaxID=3155748 RepID=UPI00343B6D06
MAPPSWVRLLAVTTVTFGAVMTSSALGGAASADPAPAGANRTVTATPDPGAAQARKKMETALASQKEMETRAESRERWAKEHGIIGMSADSAGHVTAVVPRTASARELTEVRAAAEARRTSSGGTPNAPAAKAPNTPDASNAPDTSSGLDAPSAPITVKRSTLTAADIKATADRLMAFHAEHPRYGISFRFDAAEDATVVTGDLPDALAAELRRTAGRLVLRTAPGTVVKEDVGHYSPAVSLRLREGVGRVQDRGPWHFGGARIYASDGSVCSSGFSMDADPGSDATYSTTAGHCGWIGANWLSGGYEYGTAVYRVDYPRDDVLKLDCCAENYGDRIWTSPTTTRKVSWAWDPGLGYNTPDGGSGICVSGGVTGDERCFAKITNTSATVCFANHGGCTQNLLAYERANGEQMTWSGDSGSPVYSLISDGSAEMHGTHVGLERYAYGGGAEKYVHYAVKYSTIRYNFGGTVRNW